MDSNNLTPGQSIAAIGGALLIISLFLTWDAFTSQSAFGLFSSVDIILLLIGAAALGYAALTATGSASSLPPESPQILAVLGVLAVGLTLSVDLEDPSAGLGAWLGLLSALAIAYGGFQARQELGGVGRGPRAPRARPRSASSPPPST